MSKDTDIDGNVKGLENELRAALPVAGADVLGFTRYYPPLLSS